MRMGLQEGRCCWSSVSAVKGSLWLAAGVLLWDVGIEGFYGFALLACPVWFLISLCKNVISRPGWGIGVFRIAMPVLTLVIAVSNADFQWRVSDRNAGRVIEACEDFRSENGRYPETLDELVPEYFSSVPPAKHCMLGRFWYFNFEGDCRLMWSRYGYYRRIYDFDTKRWSNLD